MIPQSATIVALFSMGFTLIPRAYPVGPGRHQVDYLYAWGVDLRQLESIRFRFIVGSSLAVCALGLMVRALWWGGLGWGDMALGLGIWSLLVLVTVLGLLHPVAVATAVVLVGCSLVLMPRRALDWIEGWSPAAWHALALASLFAAAWALRRAWLAIQDESRLRERRFGGATTSGRN